MEEDEKRDEGMPTKQVDTQDPECALLSRAVNTPIGVGTTDQDDLNVDRAICEQLFVAQDDLSKRGRLIFEALDDVDSDDPYILGFARGFEAGVNVSYDSLISSIARIDETRKLWNEFKDSNCATKGLR